MRQKSGQLDSSSERLVKIIRRATRKQYSAEEKIRVVLDGLRGEHSIAELCRREGIAESLYYSWSKEFLEAGSHQDRPEDRYRCHCVGHILVACLIHSAHRSYRRGAAN